MTRQKNTPATVLDQSQVDAFHRDGFIVLHNLFAQEELQRLDGAIMRGVHKDRCRSDHGAVYPQPSKYTIADESLLDPDLAFIAEHPLIVQGIETLLGARPCLMASVSYLRTPGAHGTAGDYEGTSESAHCDYKPFRPVGSSLNWMFAILPLTDYTPQAGPLFVSPGSHRLTRFTKDEHGIHHVQRARHQDIAPMIDPNLRRGDIVLMHGFTWHEATANRSPRDRYGIYNKYFAINAPPACGPFLFSDAQRNTLSERRRSIIAHHSDRPITRVAVLLEHRDDCLVVEDDQGQWRLPGGSTDIEAAIEEWDSGNYIGAALQHMQAQAGLAPQCLTYVGDYRNDAGLCRVYAYRVSDTMRLDIGTPGHCRWLNVGSLEELVDRNFIEAAIRRWHDRSVIHGLGQARNRG